MARLAPLATDGGAAIGLAHTRSKLQARIANDPSCRMGTGDIYKALKDLSGASPVKLPKPNCIADEATVEIRSGETVDYWKFLKGT
jgi:hypothetical protein